MTKSISSVGRILFCAGMLLAGFALIPNTVSAAGESCIDFSCSNPNDTCVNGVCESNTPLFDCNSDRTQCVSTNGGNYTSSNCDDDCTGTGGDDGGGDDDGTIPLNITAIERLSQRKIRGEASLTIDPDDSGESPRQTSGAVGTFHVVGGGSYHVEGNATRSDLYDVTAEADFQVGTGPKNVKLIFDHAPTSCRINVDCRIAWFDECAPPNSVSPACNSLKHIVCCEAGSCVKDTGQCHGVEPPAPTCSGCQVLGANGQCQDDNSRCISQSGGQCIGGSCQYPPPRTCEDSCGSTCSPATCPAGTSCGCSRSDCSSSVGTLDCSKPVVTGGVVEGHVGAPFTYSISATGNPTSYTASPLPAGLTVAGPNISGIPLLNAVGEKVVTLTASNKYGSGTAQLFITILPAQAPEIISPDTIQGVPGEAFLYQIYAKNCSAPLVCTYKTHLQSETLPPGLLDSPDQRQIVGAPAASSQGTYTVTLSATNSGGTGTKVLTILINSLPAPTGLSGQTSSTKDATFSWTAPTPVLIPVKHYGCVSGACSEVADGIYATSNCDGVTCVLPPVTHYACDGAGGCVVNPSGSFTDSNCGGTCALPPVTHYACNGSGACVVNPSGSFTDSNCGGTCALPPVTHYACNGSGGCVENAAGAFTDPNCGGTCVATTLYGCNGVSCVQMANGSTTDPTCGGTDVCLYAFCTAGSFCSADNHGWPNFDDCDRKRIETGGTWDCNENSFGCYGCGL